MQAESVATERRGGSSIRALSWAVHHRDAAWWLLLLLLGCMDNGAAVEMLRRARGLS